MSYVVAGTILLGALCGINLLLTFAILRRLKEHTQEIAHLSGGTRTSSGFDPSNYLGKSLPEFSAETVGGKAISRAGMLGKPGLIGFFAANCGPCHTQAPEFANKADDLVTDGVKLAVIAGAGEGVDDLIAVMDDVADVIVEPDTTELLKGLGIIAFPTFLQFDTEGMIVDVDVSVQRLKRLAHV